MVDTAYGYNNYYTFSFTDMLQIYLNAWQPKLMCLRKLSMKIAMLCTVLMVLILTTMNKYSVLFLRR